jgi:hypothetical protein
MLLCKLTSYALFARRMLKNKAIGRALKHIFEMQFNNNYYRSWVRISARAQDVRTAHVLYVPTYVHECTLQSFRFRDLVSIEK